MLLMSNPSSLFYISVILLHVASPKTILLLILCSGPLPEIWGTPWRSIDAVQPGERQVQLDTNQFPASCQVSDLIWQYLMLELHHLKSR